MISSTSGSNGAVLAPTSGHRGAKVSSPAPKPVRCAIYTRKSTEEGLEQEFNTLDAQREACELFIKSQVHEGWVIVPDHFDDGGFTGANIERPALKRLLAKAEAREVDIVVIYKLDRLTRSIRDFGRIMDVFDEHRVAFVAVSQRFDSSTPMGRLTLHMLLSFAQFEREMTSERTRDKMVAARRKGKWTGGFPPLGYDLVDSKLVPNPEEIPVVKEIFQLYIENRSLIATVKELNRRGWRTKAWTTKEGNQRGGFAWSRSTLHRVITSKAYIGLVEHGKLEFPGEHAAILDRRIFDRAQEIIGQGRDHGSAGSRNSFAYLLRGLVFCKACGSAMVPATTKKGKVSYRYYRCSSVDRKGTDACPVRYAPAEPLEQFVVDHLRRLGREPELIEETMKEAARQIKESLAKLGGERKRLEAESRRVQAEARQVMSSKSTGSMATARLAELEERQGRIASRVAEIEAEDRKLAEAQIDPEKAKEALALLDPVWEVLDVAERERLVRLVVERLQYEGKSAEISITLHALGLAEMTTLSESGPIE